jgi:3-oxoacyl-(acyl-carrier-protein) synthase
MYVTHTNSVYSENSELVDWITYPQKIHLVSDGGMAVSKGIKIMPAEMVDYVLRGRNGASPGTAEFIRELTGIDNLRVGLIVAAGGCVWTGYSTDVIKSEKYPVHQITTMGVTQVYAGHLANRIGKFEYVATDSVSCISGHSAWFTARNLMKLGILDAVVVVATDNGTSEEYLNVFGEYGLSKLASEEDDPHIIKFRLGQGCNITVFESKDTLAVTNNPILAHVHDMHVASEVHTSPLGISCTGSGYRKVIEGVDTRGIQFVKTHGTYSMDNLIEGKLIREYFGDIDTINYKLRIGHTMGASTAVETSLAISEESGKFLSLGAGMGNVYSAAVVEIVK